MMGRSSVARIAGVVLAIAGLQSCTGPATVVNLPLAGDGLGSAPGSGGSSGESTGFPPSSGSTDGGSISGTATLYVASGGSNSNSCMSWQTPCATIQAAIELLPPNGGIIEVGYGTFSCFTIDNSSTGYRIGVHIRGRGIGSFWNPAGTGNGQYQPGQHATIIANTSSNTDCITLRGSTAGGGFQYPEHFLLEDLAVQGTASTRDGIVVDHAPHLTLRRVVSQGNGRYGINIANSYWVFFDTVRAVYNGSDGLVTAYPVNAFEIQNGIFDLNDGNGATFGSGEAVTSISTDFSRNGGAGVIVSNGGPYSFISDFFEGNATVGITQSAGGGTYSVLYSSFPGDNAQQYGISSVSSSDEWVIVGNNFTGGDRYCSIEFRGGEPSGYIANNQAQNEGTAGAPWTNCFIVDDVQEHARVYAPTSSAPGRTYQLQQVYSQTLASPGSITIDRNTGQAQVIMLNASQGPNPTAIKNGHQGDLLTIEWVQGPGGGFGYVWPSNCKFANGAAPVASTITGYRDSVTFRYDAASSDWSEVSRAVAVH
jgi:hypothetical protein